MRSIPACAGNTTSEAPPDLVRYGPSPRVRGTRRQKNLTGECGRSIPACAGNTASAAATGRRSPVHPRVCGEHSLSTVMSPAVCGPSPRVRGTRVSQGTPHQTQRSIPACAGNTSITPPPPHSFAVHPRVCGEHTPDTRALALGLRSIPACAGNTGCVAVVLAGQSGPSPRVRGTLERLRLERPSTSVHPRVCGEHGRFDSVMTVAFRSIPACAGNTNFPTPASAPRNGPSPRVRGTLQRECLLRLLWRSIPACAGNTRPLPGLPKAAPVHPRVCGEHAEG